MPPSPEAAVRTTPPTVRRRLAGQTICTDDDSVAENSKAMLASPVAQSMERMSSPSVGSRSTLGSPLTTHASRRSGVGDLAAGPRRKNSLSEVEFLPWLCCMAPAISLFALFFSIVVTCFFFQRAFYWLTAILTMAMMFWICNLAFCSLWGSYLLRRDSHIDWNARLENLPSGDADLQDVLHIVLLPNYKENEKMLKETLLNLACSPMARERVRVVLAMEAREGDPGREKANRLISETSHLFADIFATYHPENLPGEVAGKSSNTQWAFRQSLQHYGPILMGCDLSRVFLTVGDADTLWHPQYFSALTDSVFSMPEHKRAWTIWQPPILLMRNFHNVPAMTRVTANGTLIFELSSLANQSVFPALAYSAYTMTLALATHPEVDGWDPDVIAEDHHMFCKCYFAALWESAHHAKTSKKGPADSAALEEIVPRVRIQPIFLPAVSYLVESSTYWSSLTARFQQARRHSQGVVELGYVLLQYLRLVHHTGSFNIPWRTHLSIFSIALKLFTIHIVATMQGLALVLAFVHDIFPWVASVVPWFVSEIMTNGLSLVYNLGGEFWNTWGTLGGAQKALMYSLGQFAGVSNLYNVTCFIVIVDLFSGKYYEVLPQLKLGKEERGSVDFTLPVAEHDGESDEEEFQDTVDLHPVPDFVTGPMSTMAKISLFMCISSDTLWVGWPGVICFAAIPVLLAAWSLVRRGTDFEYIVAEKPE
eukprot:TRINITY_DN29218_c0_g4_i1.p1 TRINITY_DN29218_c0_g4~~TRINITY_DN29218_c0_g4_i1.p1  ORF type:complete len:709 (-),score=128.10 TRINITY_DN29218_c0_g4_i1:129-2255(-)